jgi:hypothetical protein
MNTKRPFEPGSLVTVQYAFSVPAWRKIGSDKQDDLFSFGETGNNLGLVINTSGSHTFVLTKLGLFWIASAWLDRVINEE